MTEGRQDNDAFSNTALFSSRKSADWPGFVIIFSNNIGVVRSNDLKQKKIAMVSNHTEQNKSGLKISKYAVSFSIKICQKYR